MSMEHQFINNTNVGGAKKRFELHIDDQIAILEYFTVKGNVAYLTHTEVPPSLQGKGYASILVNEALDELNDEGTKIVPMCPYVLAFIKRHKEYGNMVLPEFEYMLH